ncbi:hypothetical protein HAX54_029871 [Datura stramonium]|uniref:Uncharacterized protein n=1 Tax=Datura stramonium TaxID=4076 RepID=A0ABS8V6P1_DATST|nr:hypothetical protein [Datura stramonium]
MTHVAQESVCLVYALITGMFINVGAIIKDVLRRESVKKGKRPRYDPKGIDKTRTKDIVGLHGSTLSIGEHYARFDNMSSHLYDMQMLQLRMNSVTEEKLQQLNMDYLLSEHTRALCGVGPGFEKPLDDDGSIDEE